MARCAIQHNGLFGKVRPVAALKLRLVAAPLRAQPFAPFGFTKPQLCLAPLRPARAAWRTCAKPHAGSHWPARYRLRRNRRGFCPGAGARSVELAPAHPVGPGACAPLARAGRWPVRPPRGLPPPPALGCGGVGGRCACAGRRSRLAGASPGKQPNSLHGAARRAPAVAHQPHPSLLARVRQRGQAVKAKPQPFGLRCCAALTAWPR